MPLSPQSVFLLEETKLKVSEKAEDGLISALRDRHFTGQVTLDFSQGTVGYATVKQMKAGKRAPESNESRLWTPRSVERPVDFSVDPPVDRPAA